MLFAQAGVEYEDVRLTGEQWGEMKASKCYSWQSADLSSLLQSARHYTLSFPLELYSYL